MIWQPLDKTHLTYLSLPSVKIAEKQDHNYSTVHVTFGSTGVQLMEISPELESVERGVTLSAHPAKRAVVRHLTVCPFVVHKNHKYHN